MMILMKGLAQNSLERFNWFPYQIIIGPKGIKDQLYDLKFRKSGDISRLSYDELLNFVQTNQ